MRRIKEIASNAKEMASNAKESASNAFSKAASFLKRQPAMASTCDGGFGGGDPSDKFTDISKQPLMNTEGQPAVTSSNRA